ncbi:MAG: hypothetical protein PHX18_03820 [Candidatus Gastranaerophilales bacterium]|nr:hypothetical protein [Candidatus Gastranaerophilales bacterium]
METKKLSMRKSVLNNLMDMISELEKKSLEDASMVVEEYLLNETMVQNEEEPVLQKIANSYLNAGKNEDIRSIEEEITGADLR